MKLRNYEKRGEVLFFITVFFVGIVIFICCSIFYKIPNYYLVQGIVFRDNLLEIMADEDDKKLLYQNGVVYIDNKKIKYDLVNVIDNALVNNDKNYSLVYLECFLDDEKENDVIDLVFIKNRIRLFEIFKLIWESD